MPVCKSANRLASGPTNSAPQHHFHPYHRTTLSSSLSRSPKKKPSSSAGTGYTWGDDPGVMPIILGQDHAARRIATAAAWKTLLPKLVYPLMQLQEGRARPERQPNSQCETGRCGGCLMGRLQADVNIISFMSRRILLSNFNYRLLILRIQQSKKCQFLTAIHALLRLWLFFALAHSLLHQSDRQNGLLILTCWSICLCSLYMESQI
jgi:hypothetical protein